MSRAAAAGAFYSPLSTGLSASAHYVGFWPGSVYYNPAGTLVAKSITLAVAGISANTIGDTSAPAAGTSNWIAAGTRVRVRNTGTIPTGLNANTLYYLGRPSATTASFHTTEADALAGTNLVSMSGGTANIVIYGADIPDYSGNSRSMYVSAQNNDATWLATPPWVSSGSSGSNDVSAASLDLSTAIKSELDFPRGSFLAAMRVKFGTLVASRSFFGCGVSGSADGPRLNIGASDTSKIQLQLYHNGAGTATTVGTSAAEAASTTKEHHIALAFDGPRQLAHLWIDGVPDLTVFNQSITVSRLNWPSVLRWGGAASNNAQAANFRDMQILSWENDSLPANITQLVAKLASVPYYRLNTREA